MFGVTFGDKHSYDDFGLVFNSKTISEPSPQTKLVKVPGRNGAIDLTEVLTGDVRYDNRTISITFTIMENASHWEAKREELANYFHGKKFHIIFDDDLSYYWLGRVEVSDLKPTQSTAEITFKCSVEPYKYNVTVDDSDFLWNPFDFENDTINNILLTITDEVDFDIDCNGRTTNPIMTVTGNVTCKYDDEDAITLPTGTNVIYDIILTEGEHTLTFDGNGTVSVDYVGGSL